MAPNSTNDPSSIFEEGNLKPGIYKIQNVFTETFADIEMHSRQVCCRPAKDLAEGRGLVCWYPSPAVSTYLTFRSGKSKASVMDIRCEG